MTALWLSHFSWKNVFSQKYDNGAFALCVLNFFCAAQKKGEPLLTRL
jgi:hypothetical protein